MKYAIGHQKPTKNPPRSHKFQGPSFIYLIVGRDYRIGDGQKFKLFESPCIDLNLGILIEAKTQDFEE